MCEECYSDENRITPLLNPLDCLENHTQYICGTCGRCICIEHDPNRGLQRWNFPFKSLEIEFSWDVSFFFATDLSEELVNVLYYSDFAHRISFPSYYLADR